MAAPPSCGRPPAASTAFPPPEKRQALPSAKLSHILVEGLGALKNTKLLFECNLRREVQMVILVLMCLLSSSRGPPPAIQMKISLIFTWRLRAAVRMGDCLVGSLQETEGIESLSLCAGG